MSYTIVNLRNERLKKIETLRKIGINPYPSTVEREDYIKDIKNNFNKYKDTESIIVGRLMSIREHGSLKFYNIQDFTDKIQIILKKDYLSSLNIDKQLLGWSELKYLDIGDFIQVKGIVVKSKTDEISINAKELKILTKSIRPLPEKWEGIKDIELKYRKRYLDLIINKKVRDLFVRKSKYWQANRDFMNKEGFIELYTPVLEHVTGGADAEPFTTHHNALDEDFYLRISPELYLKRLIGGGFEKVYTIGSCFRNEGIDDEHLQEFYTNEWYWAYVDYRKNMELAKNLYIHIAKTVYNKTKFKKGNYEFDFSDKWEEIDYCKSIKDKFQIDILKASENEMIKIVKDNGIKLEEGKVNRIRLIDNLWKLVRKDISGPAFLINEPKLTSPLAKSKQNNPDITERFHIIIAGSELGNGYSELNDPIDQYERFKVQQEAREKGDKEAQMMDLDYIEMMEYGMPPLSGFGISERLFWFLEDVSAREGTLFPQTKYFVDKQNKEIYNIKTQELKRDIKINKNKLNIKISTKITKEQALEILHKYVKSEYLIKHSKMVAYAMSQLSKKHEENENLWYITGLLHDIDYEKWPNDHPKKVKDILNKYNVESYIIEAILGHADENKLYRKNNMAKTLFAIDELIGLMYAISLLRPNKFLYMKVKSVMKQFKNKRFATKISRETIIKSTNELNIRLEDLISDLIEIFNKYIFN